MKLENKGWNFEQQHVAYLKIDCMGFVELSAVNAWPQTERQSEL